jgi:hypothetical protein
MSGPLIAGAAGWMRPLSERARSEIATRLPDLPVEIIEREFSYYIIIREGAASEPTPADVRLEIAALLKATRELARDIQEISPAVRSLVDQGGVLARDCFVRKTLAFALSDAEAGFARALEIAPKGRRMHPHTHLVRTMARIIHANGLAVDARPNGPLVTVAAILLQDAEEIVSDPRKIVSEAIRRWKLPVRK